MSRTLNVEIANNGHVFTRRWEKPESWMRITRETGYRWHEFCGDVLDPFFSGDWDFQRETARAVKKTGDKYGVGITDFFTGMVTHRFHGLSHSHPAVRRRMREWMERAMEISLEMGASAIGGRFEAVSVENLSDPKRHQDTLARLCEEYRQVAAIAQRKGISAVYIEQMYVPSMNPWTIRQTEEMLISINSGKPGVPVYPTVDVGHMAGQNYGMTAPDTDYTEWLRRFGAVCEIIHIQQTAASSSSHWPFMEEFNKKGSISIAEILKAVRLSHEQYDGNPLSRVLEPVQRTFLVIELIPGSTTHEETVLAQLRGTSEYLHQFIPENGLCMQFGE